MSFIKVSPPTSAAPDKSDKPLMDAVVALSGMLIFAVKSFGITGLFPLVSVYNPSVKVKITKLFDSSIEAVLRLGGILSFKVNIAVESDITLPLPS